MEEREEGKGGERRNRNRVENLNFPLWGNGMNWVCVWVSMWVWKKRKRKREKKEREKKERKKLDI